MPIGQIKNWIEKEKKLGSVDADSIVLATAANGQVHSRVVAIREITKEGILFFTQKRSQKAYDLNDNPVASMTLWLPMQKSEVVLDGIVKPLHKEDNIAYWNTLPRERQLRFYIYRSGQCIDSLEYLQDEYKILEIKFKDKLIPMSENYVGYCFCPQRIYFYRSQKNTFSEIVQYTLLNAEWIKQRVSP